MIKNSYCRSNNEEITRNYESKITQINELLTSYGTRVDALEHKGEETIDDKVNAIETNVVSKIDDKIDMKISIAKADVEAKIENVENDLETFNKTLTHRIDEIEGGSRSPRHRPITPYQNENAKKKRVKSAARQYNGPNKKLEEMKRWLEYQRKFTANEVKKHTDKFKDTQDNIYPKIDTSFLQRGSKSDLKRHQYDNVMHPYQSTVDDLLKSRYASQLDASSKLPPVNSSADMNRRSSPGKSNMTVIDFDTLDKVTVHKRK